MTKVLLALVGFALATVEARSQDFSQGKVLHDTHCMACHDTGVYTRANRTARDYGQIRAQVVRWQQNVSLHWNDTDVDQVASHVASRYYGLKCPEQC